MYSVHIATINGTGSKSIIVQATGVIFSYHFNCNHLFLCAACLVGSQLNSKLSVRRAFLLFCSRC